MIVPMRWSATGPVAAKGTNYPALGEASDEVCGIGTGIEPQAPFNRAGHRSR